MRKVEKGKYSFNDSIWNMRSDLVKNFIRGMMNVNIEERFSATQALEHPWIQ